MKVEVFNIVWDTDGEDVDLPTEMEIEVNEDEVQGQDEIVDFVSEEITNITGYCHSAFNISY